MKVKIEPKDMEELLNRATILFQVKKQFEYLKNERQTFWKQFCGKYNLNENKTYQINQQECSVTETEEKDE